MRFLIFLLYNLLIYPILFFFITFLSLFSKKIRYGYIGRFRTNKILKNYFNKNIIKSNIYWFHCSSFGEYLQVDPIINGIKKKKVDCKIIVSFFSPSGINNVKNKNIECKIYIPFDFYWSVNKAFNIVKPKMIIFSSADLWYNFNYIAKNKNIKMLLIGAKSKNYFENKLNLFHHIYRPLYQSFTKIYTINKNDVDIYDRYIGGGKTTHLGNPRYDQVFLKSRKIPEKNKIPIDRRKNILLLDSMHYEDRNVVLPGLVHYMKKNDNLEVFWVSHEPVSRENKYLQSIFSRQGISSEVINSLEELHNCTMRVKILNIIGVLAELYWYAKIAYVGGGFSTGVHNIMEPAVAGVPTFFGPKYQNFDEAIQTINNEAGFVIKKGRDFIEKIDSLLNKQEKIILASSQASMIIKNNIGSSERLVEEIIS